MKKHFILFCIIMLATSSFAYAQKYKINKSGIVKNKSGQVITPRFNTINQKYYNNYQANNYINNNQVNENQVQTIEFVMDYSGSMYNWIGVAKRSMATIIAQIPSNTKIGFRVFGHDNYGKNPSKINTVQDIKTIEKKGNKFKIITKRNCVGRTYGACSATEQVSPIINANTNLLLSGMNSVNVGGATPLVYALDRSVNQDLRNFDKISEKKIILITDGGENCGGDPCAFAKDLMSKRNDIHIDVVLVSSNSKALQCLSTTTGGNYYTIEDLSDFSTIITKSINTKPTTKPKTQHYEFIEN